MPHAPSNSGESPACTQATRNAVENATWSICMYQKWEAAYLSHLIPHVACPQVARNVVKRLMPAAAAVREGVLGLWRRT